jgi:hypothetical protein
MAATASVTAGLISKTQYDTFNAKLGTSTTFSGDVNGTYGTMSVDAIKGKAVTPAAYAAGQTLRYDGTQWINAALGFADLSGKPTTLSGYGITDAVSSSLAAGKILVGSAGGSATAVSMSGDATLSNTGAMTLATVTVPKGGTGATTLTSNGVLLGNGTSAVSATAAGAADQVLRVPAGGGAPAFGAIDLSKAAAVTGTLPVGSGGTGLTSFGISKVITTTGAGALQSSSCAQYQVLTFDASGAVYCANISSLTSGFVSGGNSFAAEAILGTNDSNALSFETNNTTQMTIDTSGHIGIGGASIASARFRVVDNDFTKPMATFESGCSSCGVGPVIYNNASQPGSSAMISFSTGGANGNGQFTGAIGSIRYNNNVDGGLFFTTATNGNSAERMRIDHLGQVGIATQNPRATLDVNGAITSKAAVSIASSTVDFAVANLAYTANNCGAFALHNMKDGGTYSLLVQGTTSATCSFTAFSDAGTTALTVHLPPDNGPTTTGKFTLYSFTVFGTHVISAWTPGY